MLVQWPNRFGTCLNRPCARLRGFEVSPSNFMSRPTDFSRVTEFALNSITRVRFGNDIANRMALEVYQETFCRMVALPAFRECIVQQPGEALNGLELTPRERKRLLAIASQPGMRVNTAIHRANRLTPLDQTVP